MTGAGQTPRRLAEAIERTSALDGAGRRVGETVRGRIPSGAVKDALSGAWFGHAIHPPLTDVVTGSFFGASVLDLAAPGSPEASERLLWLGIAAALPTAASGASDWADTEDADPRVRRVGVVHAAANVAALALAVGSLTARRRGSLAVGRALSAAATGALGFGGYLGGHMTYSRGVGVDQTANDHDPAESARVADHPAA